MPRWASRLCGWLAREIRSCVILDNVKIVLIIFTDPGDMICLKFKIFQKRNYSDYL